MPSASKVSTSLSLSTLSTLLTAIASARDKTTLLKTIIAELQPPFGFHDVGLFIVNEEDNYHVDLATDIPEISPSDLSFELHGVAVGKLLHQGSPVARMMNEIDSAGEPVLFDFHELTADFPEYPQFKHFPDSYRDCLATTLKVQGEVIGMFCINALEKNKLVEVDRQLFQIVADQIAVALSSILSQEQLLEEKQFKETLLDISEATTRVRNREDLLKIIREKIHPIISYADASVATFSEDYTVMNNVLILSADERMNHPLYHEVVNEPLVIEQGLPREFLEQKDVAHHSLEEMLSYWPDSPGLRLMKDTGLLDSIVLKLRSGDEVFGLLTFHFTTFQTLSEQDEALYLSVADQLAVAVSNVLANEEILKREQEKAELLQISEIVSTIRDRRDLVRFLTGTVKSLFGYKNASITVHTEKPDIITLLCTDASEEVQRLEIYQKLIACEYLVIPLTRQIMADTKVHTYHLEDLKQEYGDMVGVQLMTKLNLNVSLATSLVSGGKAFGFLEFHFENENDADNVNRNLFKNIANQVAVAVSNILANERIRQRQREKTLQVEVINALNQGRNWKDKLRRAAQKLRTQIPFSQISFGASQYSDSFPNYGFEQIGPDEYRTLELADFFRMSNLTPEMLTSALSQRTYRQTTIVNTATFREGIQENALEKAIWEVFGTRSFMVVPITLEKEEGMYVVLYSRQEDFYQDEHRQLLDSIRSSFGLALEKHLNYEKIAELNARLTQEKTYLEEEIKTHYNFGQIVGESEALQEVFTQISKVADTDSTVLLLGETGTGKELAARALHESSPRSKQSLIKVNCAALPPQLIESELFGHEKGAFTGAAQRRIGKFELAHGGTVFLDEIGELPLELQGKLLRVLQEKEFERLGSNQVRQVDVRVIAATNRDLAEEVRQGRFRQDLYFRLNVFPIQLPPLRERSEDIPLLARFFVQKYADKFKKRLPPLNRTQLKELTAYSWPGNVRELEHLIERSVIQANGQIDTLNLPLSDLTSVSASSEKANQEYIPKSWKDTEMEVLINTLRYCNGKVRGEGGAAQLLGLHPNTLESRMKKLGIKRQHIISS